MFFCHQASIQGFQEHLGLSSEKTKQAITESALLAWRAVKEEGRVENMFLYVLSDSRFHAIKTQQFKWTTGNMCRYYLLDRYPSCLLDNIIFEQVPGHVLVAGSVGPYGACLGDGSEYTGAYLQV